MAPRIIDLRLFLKLAGSGVGACLASPMALGAPFVSNRSAAAKLGTADKIIYIILFGAPSQTDTFDFRNGPWTPADFKPTTIHGIDFPEGLMPNIAQQLDRLTIVRSCQSSALVHALMLNWNQIARSPASATGRISPNIGSIVALEMEPERKDGQTLPGFVALNAGGAVVRQVYLEGRYAPFDVTPSANGLTVLQNADGQAVFNDRYALLQRLNAAGVQRQEFEEIRDFYSDGRRMMYDTAVSNLFRYSNQDQQRYGNSGFGNACIVARNLVAANLGTRFVQIHLNGWDHHQQIYARNGIYRPIAQLDGGLANLLTDLASMPGSRGGTQLDETLVVVKGEFGRTTGPLVGDAGRDHHFVHFALFAGGGTRSGRVMGGTTPDGTFVDRPGWSQNRPVTAEDVAATMYASLGIDYTTVRRDDPLGRGFEYVSASAWTPSPLRELFA